MNVAALLVSVGALLVSGAASYRQLRPAAHANTLPVLVELFREHRSDYPAEARWFVHQELPGRDVSEGLHSLRDLAWFYDNLGALVAHGIVDIDPVSGYLGGSVISTWESMAPLIAAHRVRRRAAGRDGDAEWQGYYENLYHLIKKKPPAAVRNRLERWSLNTSVPPRN
ncbi:DUF4760 domain-containing protein [Streptomyces sp. L7]